MKNRVFTIRNELEKCLPNEIIIDLQRVDGRKIGFKLPIWYPKDGKKILFPNELQ